MIQIQADEKIALLATVCSELGLDHKIVFEGQGYGELYKCHLEVKSKDKWVVISDMRDLIL